MTSKNLFLFYGARTLIVLFWLGVIFAFLFSPKVANIFRKERSITVFTWPLVLDAKYLKEGLDVTVVMHGETAIAMELPGKIEYTIAQSDPAVKGDSTSGNVQKDATTDNGLAIRVPIFRT